MDAKVKRPAVDYANPRIVDARTANGAGGSAPVPVSVPARVDAGSRQPAKREHDSDQAERVKTSFAVRAEAVVWAVEVIKPDTARSTLTRSVPLAGVVHFTWNPLKAGYRTRVFTLPCSRPW